jgi:hypothetical protein
MESRHKYKVTPQRQIRYTIESSLTFPNEMAIIRAYLLTYYGMLRTNKVIQKEVWFKNEEYRKRVSSLIKHEFSQELFKQIVKFPE